MSNERDIIIQIAGENLGRGDDELGHKLMLNFLAKLDSVKDEIKRIIFVNTGAKLTLKDSPALDALKNLENAGVELLICDSCLKHFQAYDQLAVGRLTNALEVVENLAQAKRLIQA